MPNLLNCDCGASAKDTSKERGRFKRRHPKLCYARHKLTKQLAQAVRSVEPTTWEDFREERNGR